jgi:hypothetical protein
MKVYLVGEREAVKSGIIDECGSAIFSSVIDAKNQIDLIKGALKELGPKELARLGYKETAPSIFEAELVVGNEVKGGDNEPSPYPVL